MFFCFFFLVPPFGSVPPPTLVLLFYHITVVGGTGVTAPASSGFGLSSFFLSRGERSFLPPFTHLVFVFSSAWKEGDSYQVLSHFWLSCPVLFFPLPYGFMTIGWLCGVHLVPFDLFSLISARPPAKSRVFPPVTPPFRSFFFL